MNPGRKQKTDLIDARDGTRKYWILAVSCLIYGGIAFILFLNQAHFFLERIGGHAVDRAAFLNGTGAAMSNESDGSIAQTAPIQQQGRSGQGAGGAGGSNRSSGALVELLISSTFLGSLISILAGISLIRLLRKREHKEVRTEVIDSLILPDEKRVMRELEQHGGELTQSELARNTGLSKVKVHRVVKRLESMDLVSKHPYGLTNKIRLKARLEEL